MNKIVLDPGHPSRNGDTGCIIKGWGDEFRYAYKFTELLEQRIKLSLEPFEIYKTRDHIDEVVSHEERGFRANKVRAKLSLSIHVNSHEEPNLHGAMAYILTRDSGLTCKLGDSWLRAQPKPLHVYNRKTYIINPRNFRHPFEKRVARVLSPLPEPAILLELGFASNLLDRKTILDNAGVSGMIAAFMALLARFRQIEEKTCYPLFGGD